MDSVAFEDIVVGWFCIVHGACGGGGGCQGLAGQVRVGALGAPCLFSLPHTPTCPEQRWVHRHLHQYPGSFRPPPFS